eukprot:scaffold10482_cov116-Isochrysis_galbana.AAC.9
MATTVSRVTGGRGDGPFLFPSEGFTDSAHSNGSGDDLVKISSTRVPPCLRRQSHSAYCPGPELDPEWSKCHHAPARW